MTPARSSWSWKVERAAAVRADKAACEAVKNGEGLWSGEPQKCTRSRLQKLAEDGCVRLNGGAFAADRALTAGDVVQIDFPEPVDLQLRPEDIPLDILHEDEHIAVVNKPQGMTVHPADPCHEGTLVHALLHHITDLSGIGGVMRPGIVHRIDKNTSGVLVVTKTDAAHARMSEIFAKHDIERQYWAICFGSPGKAERRIESLVGRHPSDRKKMSTAVKRGRRAVTRVRALEEFGGAKPFASLVEARLETGRTHQVRVHLAAIAGCSVIGDTLYGVPSGRHPKWLALPDTVREAAGQLAGQALHARVLGFNHPVTGRPVRFEAPPPTAFMNVLETLRRHASC